MISIRHKTASIAPFQSASEVRIIHEGFSVFSFLVISLTISGETPTERCLDGQATRTEHGELSISLPCPLLLVRFAAGGSGSVSTTESVILLSAAGPAGGMFSSSV